MLPMGSPRVPSCRIKCTHQAVPPPPPVTGEPGFTRGCGSSLIRETEMRQQVGVPAKPPEQDSRGSQVRCGGVRRPLGEVGGEEAREHSGCLPEPQDGTPQHAPPVSGETLRRRGVSSPWAALPAPSSFSRAEGWSPPRWGSSEKLLALRVLVHPPASRVQPPSLPPACRGLS